MIWKFCEFVQSSLFTGHLNKLIATGPKSKTLHKEELGLSQTEMKIKQNVQDKVAMSASVNKGRPQLSRTAEALRRQNTPKVLLPIFMIFLMKCIFMLTLYILANS